MGDSYNPGWSFIKRCLAVRREAKKLRALGYIRHETDWEVIRGSASLRGEVIVDAIVSVDGLGVWTKIGKRVVKSE